MANLIKYAYIIRSKNAGPFLITLDIFFKSRDIYEKIKRLRIFSIEELAKLFNVSKDDIKGVYFIDNINTVKITLRRPTPSGSIYDKDIYGAQQHNPLLKIEIPEDL